MNRRTRLPSRDVLEARARAAGYAVHYVDHRIAASASCPHMAPAAGLCDKVGREIIVSTRDRGEREILAILIHEIEHAEGAEYGRDFPEYGLRCGGTITKFGQGK